jgi:M6 family metalloprotease-like protein
MTGGTMPRETQIEISIRNDTTEIATVFRIHPTTFEEEPLVDLAPGEIKKVTVPEAECLIAKAGHRVISSLGVCAELSEWRLDANDGQSRSSCPFVVSNQRGETVNIFCTGANDETLMIRVLHPGEQAILNSFKQDYWEATIDGTVISAYQPSERLPNWTITDWNSDFVAELPSNGNDNLNETYDPRRDPADAKKWLDLVGLGDVKAVMVFIDFSDVHGTRSPADVKQLIVGDAAEWFRKESFGRLNFSVDTPFLEWRRMPEPATAYAAIATKGEMHKSYISTALKLFRTDEIDFNSYQIAYVVAAETPENNPTYEKVLHNSPTLSNGIHVETNNATVLHAVAFGRDSYWRGYRVLVHETGHLFGLPDLYLFGGDDARFARAGAWDIMCHLDNGRHFLGWHKYKLGWLDECQLIYLLGGEVSVTLTSFEAAQGVKMIVLPGQHASKRYVVEVAQSLGDGDQFRDKGLLVYTVDASKATGEEPVSVLPCGVGEEDGPVGERRNAYLAPGKTHAFKIDNARVEVTNHQRSGPDFDVTVKFITE